MDDSKQSTIDKVLTILHILSQAPFEYKVAQVSAASGINRTTVHRILNLLEKDGWVMQNEESKKFKVGPMTYHVGSVYAGNYNYESKILEVIDRTSKLTQESVGYAVREGDMVISLYEVELYQPMKMNYKPGMFYPMNMGCYGKCLMAYHDQDRVKSLLNSQEFKKICPNTLTKTEEILEEYKRIREEGYVISNEEKGPNIAGVGVPVFNAKGEVKSCIALAFIKGPDFAERIERYRKILSQGAEEISKYMP
ncbi:IclR family transcriptional regulator [Sinanaerobacter chloroacetimidivorans]|uniref:IclR family transcriptional regulator n=1 Tax=Sinanaerobacter chloroacetimidivorans TaxID=2818044 RepID=A0A8J8B349_9FIRM|nr:IclR family transcriptional regulator [Sinanaerobacter chloroacetimidivorans]MBR0597940.1 IclR family transcriptional regulator [Sinanaerobacter chloroacetimidivorans]